VRVVGVGQFAQGVARRRAPRREARGLRRVASIVVSVLVVLVFVLWIAARVAGHL